MQGSLKNCFLLISTLLLISCGGGGGNNLPDAPTPDTIPPIITLITPTPGIKTESINPTIEITFNENIKQADTSNILIRPYDSTGNLSNPVDLTLGKFQSVNKILTLTNIIPTLKDNSRYQITVKDIKDSSDNRMETQCQWDFGTGAYTGVINSISSSNCGSGPNTPDIISPKVIAITPTGNTVPDTSNITIGFDKAIDATSINNTSIIVTTILNGAPVPVSTYTYNYNPQSFTAILTPKSNPALKLNTEYTITIKSGSDNTCIDCIKDTNGNPLENDFSASFKTFADVTEDTNPPFVISTSPLSNETINPDRNIIIRFNEAMDPTTTILANFKLSQIVTGADNIPVDLINIYTATYNTTRNEITLSVIPGQQLAYKTQYEIQVLTGITDKQGNALTVIKPTTFTTADSLPKVDSISPVIFVKKVFPPKNGPLQEPTINIVVPFSEPMNETTLRSSITLNSINGTILNPKNTLNDLYTYAYDTITNTVTYTLKPDRLLSYATVYQLTVPARVNDLAGNELAVDFVRQFTTTALKDTIKPSVISVVPNEGSTIAVNKDLIVTFSEPMLVGTFAGNFKLYEIINGVQSPELTLPYTINPNQALNVVTLKPDPALPPLTPLKEYRLVVSGNGNGVLDTAGNTMAANSETNFKTAAASNQWTWVGGSQNINSISVFSGINPPTHPGNRAASVSWKATNNTFWFFGGAEYLADVNKSNLLNELWKYDSINDLWTEVSLRRTRIANSSGQYGDSLAPPIPINTPSSFIYPGARTGASTWVDKNENLWLFGGTGYDSTGTYGGLTDLWKYNPPSKQWTWIKGSKDTNSLSSYGTKGIALDSNQPPSRPGASTWVDINGDFWMFGGALRSDVWKYRLKDNMWIWISGSDLINQKGVYTATNLVPVTPGDHSYSAHWTDNSGNFWLFGGFGRSENIGYQNDLWKYTLPTPSSPTGTWAFIGGSSRSNAQGVYGQKLTTAPNSNNIPGARDRATFWQDTKGNLWLYGGQFGFDLTYQDFSVLNDLWKFNIQTQKWTWMHGTDTAWPRPPAIYGTVGSSSNTTTPGSRHFAVGWTDLNDNLWLFGGDRNGDSRNRTYKNDLWKYTP